MNIQGLFSLGLTGFISLQSKELSRDFSSSTNGKHQLFRPSAFMVQLSHPYMTTQKNKQTKNVTLTIWAFLAKWFLCLLSCYLGLTSHDMPYPGGGHGNPLQYSWLENPHRQKSLAGCNPWDHTELDTTKWLSTMFDSFLSKDQMSFNFMASVTIQWF